jgi:hypothetical protein
MIRAMNTQIDKNPARQGRRVARTGRAIAAIFCVAFMLDCLADESWPDAIRS